MTPSLDPQLLDLIACPACRSPLQPDEAAAELRCTGCGLVYPIQDGIPVLLVEHARRPAP